MDFDQSYTNEFLTEAREHMQIVEGGLLKLEKAGGQPVPEVIGQLFRSIHSIKGTAAFLGFSKIKELAHIMETLLQMMRGGEINPEPLYVDPLLAGVDMLNILLDDLANSNNVDIQVVYDSLSTIVGKATSPQTQCMMNSSLSLVDMAGDPIGFEVSDYDLTHRPATHEFLYLLKFDLEKLGREGGVTPVALIKNLLGTGIIMDSRIDTDARDLTTSLENSHLFYYVIYSTLMNAELVSLASGLPSESIQEINQEVLLNQAPAEKMGTLDMALTETEKLPEQKKETLPVVRTESNKKDSAQNKEESDISDTIRVNVNILNNLMTLAGELVLVRNQHLLSVDSSNPASRGLSQRLNLVTTELQQTIMQTRMQPIGNVFGKLPRIVRDLSRKLNKRIEIQLSGNEVELDKTILESLTDPLTHIIRNCCDHGIETPAEREVSGKAPVGNVLVNAFHEAGQINLEIHDDGKGIDPDIIKNKALENKLKTEEQLVHMNEKDILSLVMMPGFSTASEVTEVSGRGVGMDVVATAIKQLGGVIELESTVGKGTTLRLRLPLTLAIIPCLIVIVDNYRYAIPQINLEELVCLYDDDIDTKIECAGNQELYRLRDQLLPIVRLNEVLNRPTRFSENDLTDIISQYHQSPDSPASLDHAAAQSLNLAVVKVGSRRFGLILDQVIGTEEIVVKPMHSSVKNLKIYSGATIMGDGKVAMILDIEGVFRHAGLNFSVKAEQDQAELEKNTVMDEDSQTVLLFQSGEKEQFAISLPLVRRIERIPTSKINMIDNKEYITIEDQSTLVLRLDQLLGVSPAVDREEMYLLLPKYIHRKFGILVSRIIDVEQTILDLDTDSYMEDGVLGTSIVRDKMTIFIDIYRLIEIEEPDWFKERRSNDPPPEEKKRILLLEDAKFFRQLIKGYLEADNYEVTVAENGKQGLELVRQAEFDLIISDIEMPEMDGWTFMSTFRAENAGRYVPSIALTALNSENDKQRGFEVGFDRFEEKINREQLLTVTAQLLDPKTHASEQGA